MNKRKNTTQRRAQKRNSPGSGNVAGESMKATTVAADNITFAPRTEINTENPYITIYASLADFRHVKAEPGPLGGQTT